MPEDRKFSVTYNLLSDLEVIVNRFLEPMWPNPYYIVITFRLLIHLGPGFMNDSWSGTNFTFIAKHKGRVACNMTWSCQCVS